jgi:tRNA modification GTPase
MSSDTIVAIATPPGRGGVAIIRLSGSQSVFIAKQLTALHSLTPRVAYYATFKTRDNELIDQGIVLYFKAPSSFTGEDVIEFQVHGSPMVMDCLIKECLSLNARLAKPGEFSERAFLNDKMDLTQAEAIADLIHASSQTAARMAVRSLQGDFSKKINELNEQLIYLRLYVEAAIDFPEEEIDFLNDGKVTSKLTAIIDDLASIRANAAQGSIFREGLSVVIAGRPNAGKSTLINLLAGRELAIVTDIAGTTRDVLREHLLLDDIPLNIIDTAGLHDSDDVVEKEGIRRAWEEVARADCVLLVIDINDAVKDTELDQAIAAVLAENVPIIRVYNKIDLTEPRPLGSGFPLPDGRGLIRTDEDESVFLSAKSGEGLPLLRAKIKEAVGYQPTEGQFLARRRHIEALDNAYTLVLTGQEQLSKHRAGELLAEDLRLAHQSLCEITGEFTPDDLLGEIFSKFCIGK